MLTFASNPLHKRLSLQRRFKSAAKASHMQTFPSTSLQIRCTCSAYADFRLNIASNPHSLRTKAPSAAVWAKPSWIMLPHIQPVLLNPGKDCHGTNGKAHFESTCTPSDFLTNWMDRQALTN